MVLCLRMALYSLKISFSRQPPCLGLSCRSWPIFAGCNFNGNLFSEPSQYCSGLFSSSHSVWALADCWFPVGVASTGGK